MGLDTTHNAFSGAYSAFNRFRQIVAKAAGGSYPHHEVPLVLKDEIIENPDQNMFYIPNWEQTQTKHPGLATFLFSNDCEGEFPPELCEKMADDLQQLLPEIERLSPNFQPVRGEAMIDVAKRYIAGCRAAHEAGENLEYL